MNKSTRYLILKELENKYSGQGCGLNFKSPYELLIATILSAQCTDVRVNIVTKDLFKEYNTPEKMIELNEDEIADYIKTCGFYKVKAKNILETSKKLVKEYDSEVPKSMEELVKLNGVGRKTANVVMSNAYGIPAIAVDTHVFRVSNRLGIAKGDNVEKVEEELKKHFEKKVWSDLHHYLIWHGRKVCAARKPKCEECTLNINCEYNKKNNI